MALALPNFSRSASRVSVFAMACFGLVVIAPASAKQRQPAPVVFTDSAPRTQALAGLSAPVAPAGAEGGKRLSFRYPDQPDREYGYGAQETKPSPAPALDLRAQMAAANSAPTRAFNPRAAVAASEAVEPPPAPAFVAPLPSQPDVEGPAQAGLQEPVTAKPARPEWLERERVGAPYQANGRWYAPAAEPGYTETGHASWYGDEFHGRRTANGEVFDQTALTAAHPTLPIPSLVQVTNLANGKEVIVRVNDRGPFVEGRMIDVSKKAAEVLGFADQGSARVHVRYLGPAPKRVNADRAATVAPPQAPPPRPLAQTPPRAPIVAPVERSPLRAAAPSRSENGFMVQVGAFASAANANRVRQRVSAAGDVTIDALPSAGGGEVFRVRVGPWASRAAAERALGVIQAEGLSGAVVSANSP
jgi:rare lipoprotein A